MSRRQRLRLLRPHFQRHHQVNRPQVHLRLAVRCSDARTAERFKYAGRAPKGSFRSRPYLARKQPATVTRNRALVRRFPTRTAVQPIISSVPTTATSPIRRNAASITLVTIISRRLSVASKARFTSRTEPNA